MFYFNLILGAVLIIAGTITLIVSVKRTPNNLRGYYGAMFSVFAAALMLGGAASIAFGVFQLM